MGDESEREMKQELRQLVEEWRDEIEPANYDRQGQGKVRTLNRCAHDLEGVLDKYAEAESDTVTLQLTEAEAHTVYKYLKPALGGDYNDDVVRRRIQSFVDQLEEVLE